MGGIAIYELYAGGYFSAWFTACIVALVALMALSIPRSIVVTDERIEVRCLLDFTEVKRDEIISVKRIDRGRMRWMFPIFGVYGFFGYYGNFIDLKRFDMVKIYATEWCNFVEIINVDEERLYLSCRDADALIAEISPKGGNQEPEE